MMQIVESTLGFAQLMLISYVYVVCTHVVGNLILEMALILVRMGGSIVVAVDLNVAVVPVVVTVVPVVVIKA